MILMSFQEIHQVQQSNFSIKDSCVFTDWVSVILTPDTFIAFASVTKFLSLSVIEVKFNHQEFP